MKKLIITTLMACSGFALFSCNNAETTTDTIDTQQVSNEPQIINVSAFQEAISKDTNIYILDVRTPEEFKGGAIPNAINMNFNDPSFTNSVNQLDKNKPIYVYCLSGGRSGSAVKVLKDQGFKEVYGLDGGILKWKAAGLNLTEVDKETSAEKSKVAMNLSEYNQIIADKKNVVVDFYADWCAPCKLMSPILLDLEKNSNDKFHLLKVDVDKSVALANEFKINSIPFLIVYKDGKEVARIVGFEGEAPLRKKINDLFSN